MIPKILGFNELADHETITVNPARAGMIRVLEAIGSSGCGKPRASGDDPQHSPGRDCAVG